MSTILIVDDDAAMRESLAETITDLGHGTVAKESGQAALDYLRTKRVDAVLLDLRMPGMDGIEVLKRIQTHADPPPVVVLTAFATAGNTIEAMRLGAFDHLTKPIGRQDVVDLLGRMLPKEVRSAGRSEQLNSDVIIGHSAAMRTLQKSIGMLADKDTTVLILGETGAGKEVVARALHAHGRRAQGAFVAVNCAAIPADLLESELFGHVRGSFTGAVADRKGAFRDAEKGTLFLDEIGDMPLAMQAKILRVLEERVVTPVGGKPVPVDVRVLAATHRDLATLVANKHFREDLYYRLSVVPVVVPPLRERRDDILPLAEHFLRLTEAPAKVLSADAADRLRRYDWPGNVRQLKNVMERCQALVRSPIIAAHDLELHTTAISTSAVHAEPTDLTDAVAGLERRMIEAALAESGGNRAEAARHLGINRQLLYTKMKRYGLSEAEASEIPTRDVGNDDA
ncbi:sigma-54 dependent transcriptional regulator [Hyphomicrobium sp.]|uniref:sigma-54-dependent transcriptional regulator n=1 Tax=Hyphomicrobium sp. TaxID=82 RepID=UPI000FB0ED32|nr:sigma-54 dependent transcriptional regulator [Hyphomicrobium sp.]RUP10756.1 MAG: sigma-54-dependent Fis family transcriptional regulator [Hyphomicrobium sp.]